MMAEPIIGRCAASAMLQNRARSMASNSGRSSSRTWKGLAGVPGRE